MYRCTYAESPLTYGETTIDKYIHLTVSTPERTLRGCLVYAQARHAKSGAAKYFGDRFVHPYFAKILAWLRKLGFKPNASLWYQLMPKFWYGECQPQFKQPLVCFWLLTFGEQIQKTHVPTFMLQHVEHLITSCIRSPATDTIST
jgi:hypothetical protein